MGSWCLLACVRQSVEKRRVEIYPGWDGNDAGDGSLVDIVLVGMLRLRDEL